MPRRSCKRRRSRCKSTGQFQSENSPVATAVQDTSQPPENSSLCPMEDEEEPPDGDGDDDEWHSEDAGGTSDGGQATLHFGSPALGMSTAGARTTQQSLYSEVAPRQRAAGFPSRATLHRRKQASLGAVQGGMASFMASWLRNGAEQQSSLPHNSETEGAPEVEVGEGKSLGPAASVSDVESPVPSESNVESCTNSDKLVCDGAGPPLEDWVGEDEKEAAQRILDERCDKDSCGSFGFLDGHDYPSDLSDSREESDTEFNGDVETRRAGGAAATGECHSSGETTTASKQPAAAVRRSSRGTFKANYGPPRRHSAKSTGTGGPGRGTRMMLPDEISDPLLRLRRKNSKKLRANRRVQVKLVGELQTKEQRARLAKRTRINSSVSRKAPIETYRKALDKIVKPRSKRNEEAATSPPAGEAYENGEGVGPRPSGGKAKKN